MGARIDKTVVAAGSFADEIKQAFDADGNGKVESDELGAVAKSAAAFIGTTARAAVAGVQGVVSGVADKAKEIVDEAKERVEAANAEASEAAKKAAEKVADEVEDVKAEFVDDKKDDEK